MRNLSKYGEIYISFSISEKPYILLSCIQCNHRYENMDEFLSHTQNLDLNNEYDDYAFCPQNAGKVFENDKSGSSSPSTIKIEKDPLDNLDNTTADFYSELHVQDAHDDEDNNTESNDYHEIDNDTDDDRDFNFTEEDIGNDLKNLYENHEFVSSIIEAYKQQEPLWNKNKISSNISEGYEIIRKLINEKYNINTNAYPRNLANHKKIHSNVRDQVCDTCGKAFTSTNILNQHKKVHNGQKLEAASLFSGPNASREVFIAARILSGVDGS
ncbi:uncharacterized protein [Musca autumnalis]|uniref:uncharacterized protein n=1 Tax=Musca autumnalis TaxID=221902 RepID=UPI003CF46C4A